MSKLHLSSTSENQSRGYHLEAKLDFRIISETGILRSFICLCSDLATSMRPLRMQVVIARPKQNFLMSRSPSQCLCIRANTSRAPSTEARAWHTSIAAANTPACGAGTRACLPPSIRTPVVSIAVSTLKLSETSRGPRAMIRAVHN